jgi:hypothetical protein
MFRFSCVMLTALAISAGICVGEDAPKPIEPPKPVAPVVEQPRPADAPKPIGAAAPVPVPVPAPMADGPKADPVPPVPTPAPHEHGLAPKYPPMDLTKIYQDMASVDAAVRMAAVKSLLDALQEPAKKLNLKYVASMTEVFSGADAAKKESASKTIDNAVTTHRKRGDEKQQADYAAKISAGESEPRDNLATFINEFAKGEEIEKYIQQLASADAASVTEAIKKLKEFGADSTDYLITALEDENPAIKNKSAEVLQQLGAAAVKGSSSDLVWLLESEDKAARKLAAGVLESIAPEADADLADDLMRYMDDDDKTIRRMAAGIMKKMGAKAKDSAGDLVDLLTADDDKNARMHATEVLIGLGANAKTCTDTLAGIVDDTENDADSRTRAANVLAAIGPDAKAALETLKKHQADANPELKAAIAAAVQKIEAK